MKFKKLLAMALVASFALSNVVTVSATEMSIAEDSSQTGTVPSGFNVDNSLVGGGVVVRVPANLDLTYDSSVDAFRVSDVVGAKGSMRDIYSLTVSINDTLTYNLADSEKTVEARVRFGENTNGVGTNAWDSEQVALGATDDSQMDCRPLIIDISSMDIEDIGNYSATAEFDIKLAPIGMYSSIAEPTDIESVGYALLPTYERTDSEYTSFYGTSKLDAYGYVTGKDASNITVEELNLVGLSETAAYIYAGGSSNPNNTVKRVELDSNTFINPYIIVDRDPSEMCYEPGVNFPSSSFMNFEELSLLVIPEDINENAFIYQSSWGDPSACVFDCPNTNLGTAFAFCKGIDEYNLFVYIPHIVYRGTTDQWKALSGHDDWVFSNAANVVTVHCTDGILTY